MKINKISYLILLTFLFIYSNLIFANSEKKGRLKSNRLKNPIKRVQIAQPYPCLLIKSFFSDLEFYWGNNRLPTKEYNGEIKEYEGYIIVILRPGAQTIKVIAKNYEPLEMELELKSKEVQIYEITQEQPPELAEDHTKPNDIFTATQININKRKIAIRVRKDLSGFTLVDSQFLKIKRHILTHYKDMKDIYLLSEKQAEDVFEKKERRIPLSDLKKQKKVDYLLDCDAWIFKKDTIRPSESIIYINMKLIYMQKGIEMEKKIFTNGKLKNYFPTKIDSALAIVDSIIKKRSICKRIAEFIISEKGWGIIGTAIISAALIRDCLCNTKERKSLPDVPDFPKP